MRRARASPCRSPLRCSAPLAAAPARAQDYPSRPIKIIVPLAPGGLADTLARIVSQRLAEASGQSVVVENRPGGAGAIGAEAAARSPADGYTLFMGSLATNAVIAHLTRLAFDPAKDLVPITHVATFPNVLVVNPALPAKSVPELVAYAKANPGKLAYASQGNAASGHLVGEQFKQLAGIEMVHVPYRGAAPAIADLVAGHVQVMFDSVTLQTPLINDGKTRGLAVLTPQRIGSIRDVPTMEEAGYRMQSGTWFGMFAPPARRARRSTGSTGRPGRHSRSARCASATSRRAPRCRSEARRNSPPTSRPSGSAGARSSARPESGLSERMRALVDPSRYSLSYQHGTEQPSTGRGLAPPWSTASGGIGDVDALALDYRGAATNLRMNCGDILSEEPDEEQLDAGQEEQAHDERDSPSWCSIRRHYIHRYRKQRIKEA